MAGTPIEEKPRRAVPGANHQPRARERTRVRAVVLAIATLALALGGGAATSGVAASSVLPAAAGGAQLAVGVENSVISTEIHAQIHVPITTAYVGESVHPGVSIQGLSGTPTGQVSIRYYGNGTCAGSYDFTKLETLTGGAVDSYQDVFSSKTARSRAVQVVYLGNTTYAMSIGACVPIAFVKSTPTVSLVVHNAAHEVVDDVPFTQTVHAAATVTGAFDDPKNWFVVRGWTNGTCTGTDYVYATRNVDENGLADDALPLGFDKAGLRSYRARYSGDASYNAVWSECVTVEGLRIAPKLTFRLHDSAHAVPASKVLIGKPIHAFAGVTGSAGLPGGDVTIRMYNDATCGSPGNVLTASAAASIDSELTTQVRSTPGTRSWRATYGGDPRYTSVTSSCRAQRWVAQPTVSLRIHNSAHSTVTSVTVGTKVHFRAAVSGSFGGATGTVVFRRASTSSCSGGTSLGSGTLAAGVVHLSTIAFKPTTAGTYWFQATYKGDSRYASRRSACLALKVKALTTSATTGSVIAAPTLVGRRP